MARTISRGAVLAVAVGLSAGLVIGCGGGSSAPGSSNLVQTGGEGKSKGKKGVMEAGLEEATPPKK